VPDLAAAAMAHAIVTAAGAAPGHVVVGNEPALVFFPARTKVAGR
jgi:hypothetical protein